MKRIRHTPHYFEEQISMRDAVLQIRDFHVMKRRRSGGGLCNSINVTQYMSAQPFLVLIKQGYMFRLKVSHLQALTTFSVTRCFAHFGIP